MALRDRFVTLLPNVTLINLYSISECHDVAVHDLSKGELEKVRFYKCFIMTANYLQIFS